jgi:KDPG and KHG aldolase.
MFKWEIMNRIINSGVMAIVRTQTMERGIEIAEGCLEGGIDVIEISYTFPNAGEIIKGLNEKFGHRLLVGAGTVLDSETARLAILNGAKFVIAPHFSKEVARLCNRYQVPYAPGCTSVAEIIHALEAGASLIKAFPISNFYGPELVSILRTPFPDLPILASGGIQLNNLAEWVESGVNCVGIGSLLTKGSREEIADNAKRIRQILDRAGKPVQ